MSDLGSCHGISKALDAYLKLGPKQFQIALFYYFSFLVSSCFLSFLFRNTVCLSAHLHTRLRTWHTVCRLIKLSKLYFVP